MPTLATEVTETRFKSLGMSRSLLFLEGSFPCRGHLGFLVPGDGGGGDGDDDGGGGGRDDGGGGDDDVKIGPSRN